MKIVNKKIKELYGTDKLFCKENGLDISNFSRTKKKHKKWIKEISHTYSSLGLKVEILPKNAAVSNRLL